MAQAHNLPVEILKLIFLRICDFHTIDMHHCTPDNMISQHPIIKDCRAVCRRWREIIDWSTSKPYQVQCCTQISLTLTNALISKGADFVRSLVLFKKSLTTARGRLMANFHLELNNEEGALMYISSMFMRLFLRGFEMMAPYRNKLCSLTVDTDQPMFLAVVFRFLTEPAPCARLNQLYISCTPHVNYIPISLTEGLGWPDMIDLRELKTVKPLDADEYRYGIFSRLTDLTLRCPLRLVSDRQFTMLSLFSVTALEISHGDLAMSLSRLDLLHRTLRSLSIVGGKEQETTPSSKELEGMTAVEMPHLRSLQFTDVREHWVWIYLRHLSCPRLEYISLNRSSDINIDDGPKLVLHELLHDKLGMTYWDLLTARSNGSALNVEMLHALEWPERDLTIEGLDFSWTSFPLSHESPPDYSVTMSCMKEVLSDFRPRFLEIETMKPDIVLLLLGSLDLRFLRRLRISNVRSFSGSLDWQCTINMLELEELVFDRIDSEMCRSFMQHLDASGLEVKVRRYEARD